MSENVNSKNQVLEVEVIIPEEILKENEELNSLYDSKKKIIRYDIAPETTEDLKSKLVEMVKTSSTGDLVAFNPIIAALNYIQSFKEIKYDPEKKNTQDYTDAKVKIGKFNAAVTKTAKAIKDPHNAYTKMLVNLEALLKQESANVRSALDTNFKEYLDEEAKKAQEKLDKKNAATNKIISDLSEENAANLEKLKNQAKATRKAEIENIINKVGIDVGLEVPKLNLEGLKAYRDKILNAKMGDPNTPEIEFSSEEKTEFSQAWSTAVLAAVNVIDMAIKSNETSAENAKIATENEVLKANTPSGVFTVDDDDMPFAVPAPQEAKQPEPEQPYVPVTDAEKFQAVVDLLEKMDAFSKETYQAIIAFQFDDLNIQKVQSKLDSSIKNILDWTEKSLNWTTDKKNQYINFLNSQQNEI